MTQTRDFGEQYKMDTWTFKHFQTHSHSDNFLKRWGSFRMDWSETFLGLF